MKLPRFTFIDEICSCTGIDWQNVRQQEAPSIAPPPAEPQSSADDFDWEWSSMAAALPVYYSTDACPPEAQTGPCAAPTAAITPASSTAATNGSVVAEPSQIPVLAPPSSPAQGSLDSKDVASAVQTSPSFKERPLAVKVPSSACHQEWQSPRQASSPQHVSLPASPSKPQPHAKSPAQGSPGHHHCTGSRPTSPHGSKAASHAVRKGDWSHNALQGADANATNASNSSNTTNADLEVYEAGAMLMHQAILNSIGLPSGHHGGGGFSQSAKDSDT